MREGTDATLERRKLCSDNILRDFTYDQMYELRFLTLIILINFTLQVVFRKKKTSFCCIIEKKPSGFHMPFHS